MIDLLRRFSIRSRIISLSLVMALLSGILVFLILSGIGTRLRWPEVASLRLFFSLLLGVIVFLSFFLVSLAIAHSITDPLEQTRRALDEFRMGKLDANVRVGGSDDISLLSLTASQVLSQLAKSYQELERRIEERTQTLSQRAVQLQTAAEVARDAATVTELNSLIQRAVNLIQDRFEFAYVGIFLLDDERKNAVLRAGTGEAGYALLRRHFRIKVGDVGLVGFATATGDPRVVNDVEADFAYVRDPALPLTRSEAVLPLKVGTVVIGALDVHSDKLNAFSSEDIFVLQTMAGQLAVAIQNARLVSDLQGRIDELRLLYQRLTRETWAGEQAAGVQKGYQYDLVDVAPSKLSLPADMLTQLQAGHPVLLPAQPSEETESKASQDIDSVSPGEDLPEGSQARHATVLAPLMMYNQLVGVVGLEDVDPGRNWSEDEIGVLQTLTSQISLALDNVRLLDESERRSSQLRLLQEVTAEAASHTDETELLDHVVRRLRSGLGLKHCSAISFDADGIYATVISDASGEEASSNPEDRGRKLPLEGNLLFKEVISSARSLAVHDVKQDPLAASMRDYLAWRGTTAMIVAPLLHRGKVIGALTLETGEAGFRYINEDLLLMDQVNLQIATAIEVARSFESATQRMERERVIGEITARLQQSLDVEVVLQTAAQDIRQALGLKDVAIILGAGQDQPENRSPEGT